MSAQVFRIFTSDRFCHFLSFQVVLAGFQLLYQEPHTHTSGTETLNLAVASGAVCVCFGHTFIIQQTWGQTLADWFCQHSLLWGQMSFEGHQLMKRGQKWGCCCSEQLLADSKGQIRAENSAWTFVGPGGSWGTKECLSWVWHCDNFVTHFFFCCYQAGEISSAG